MYISFSARPLISRERSRIARARRKAAESASLGAWIALISSPSQGERGRPGGTPDEGLKFLQQLLRRKWKFVPRIAMTTTTATLAIAAVTFARSEMCPKSDETAAIFVRQPEGTLSRP